MRLDTSGSLPSCNSSLRLGDVVGYSPTVDTRKLGGAFLLVWAGCNCGPDVVAQTSEGGGDGGGTAITEGSSGPVDPSTSGSPPLSGSGGTTMPIGSGSTTEQTADSGSSGESSSSTGEPSQLGTWTFNFDEFCTTLELVTDGLLCWHTTGYGTTQEVYRIDRETGQFDPQFGDGGLRTIPDLADLTTYGDSLYATTLSEESPRLLRLDDTTGELIYEVERPTLGGPGNGGSSEVYVEDDTVFVLDLLPSDDGELHVRTYQADDGVFIGDYPVGVTVGELGGSGATGRIIVAGGLLTTAINPLGGSWGNQSRIHLRLTDVATGTVLGEELSDIEAYLGDVAVRGDRMLWEGQNLDTDERVLDEAFGPFGFTSAQLAPDMIEPRGLFSRDNTLYMIGRALRENAQTVWRVERRRLDTGELDPMFGVDGALEGESSEPALRAVVEDEEGVFLLFTVMQNGVWSSTVERRALPSGSL